MLRVPLGIVLVFAAAATFGLLDPHVPRIVSLVAMMAVAYPAGVLLGLNEPRHSRRSRPQ